MLRVLAVVLLTACVMAAALDAPVPTASIEDVVSRDASDVSDERSMGDTEDTVALAEGLEHAEPLSSTLTVAVDEADQLSDEETVDDEAVDTTAVAAAELASHATQTATAAAATAAVATVHAEAKAEAKAVETAKAKAETEAEAEAEAEDSEEGLESIEMDDADLADDAAEDSDAENLESISGDNLADSEDSEFDGDYNFIQITEAGDEEEADSEEADEQAEDETVGESEAEAEAEGEEEADSEAETEGEAEAEAEAEGEAESADAVDNEETEWNAGPALVETRASVRGGALEAVEEALAEEDARATLGMGAAPAFEEDSDSEESVDSEELAIANDSVLNDAIAEANEWAADSDSESEEADE